MRIVVFTSTLTLSTTFIFHQIKELEKKGIEVKLFIQEDKSQNNYKLEYSLLPKQNIIENYLTRILNKLNIKYYFFNYRLKKELFHFLKSYKPDLFLIHFGFNLIRIYPFINQFNFPVVTIFHGVDASKMLRKNSYVKSLHQIFKNNNTYASCVAYDMISRFNALDIYTKRFSFHHLGTDTNYFNPVDNKRNTKDFLQISNFVEKKGHDITVKAFHRYIKKYNDNESKLIFAGTGKTLKQIKNMVDSLGLEKRIIFAGPKNISEVRNLMNSYKYFVHHSITSQDGDQEGIPTVLMEAMAMNMNVISTYHSGIPELINANNGILVKEYDIEAMSDAFHTIKNKNFNSREYIIKKFDIKTNTINFINYLEKLINKNYL